MSFVGPGGVGAASSTTSPLACLDEEDWLTATATPISVSTSNGTAMRQRFCTTRRDEYRSTARLPLAASTRVPRRP